MPSPIVLSVLAAASFVAVTPAAGSSPAQTQPPPQNPAAQPGGQPVAQQGQQARRPRPYAQVITNRAVSDPGGITVHRVDDRYFFEVPDSLLRRDFLFVSRISGLPASFGGLAYAGMSIEDRVVRWERTGDRIALRTMEVSAYADDSLPIARSVTTNNVGPILAAFPIQAFGRDSTTYVVDVTDFFAGDTPGISGLNAAQRRQWQVRRLDPARSFINTVKSFPLNVEVRHTQTFDAGEPPGDRTSGTISMEMSQSLVALPKVPMRPRYADQRIGYITHERVNYGLDQQKAATQTFIRRWRLEPKDPAAYARGELVEPVKPIEYYIDPATPAKWRPYVRLGIEDWKKPFEAAGFKNAIVAKDAPTPEQDPDWDPEDIRYSVVRWSASLVRNAVGPSTADPRTGEIIESDINWYHNHMRSYRNRLMIETGAANPAARSLEIPEDLMGETMRQVITHEVGHALGLPHNMVASSSFPVDSLRKATFTRKYGVSATIMDYARQNYIAQPEDKLEPKDFIRRLGPFDDYVINWGYRVLPQAPTPEAERPILNGWYVNQKGPMPYRYVPQQYSGIDPRAQTEDMSDDPVRASGYAVANLKRVVPNLVPWITKPAQSYQDLEELYTETIGMWATYMGHVTTLIGGMNVDFKTGEQAGPVYHPVPKAKQKAALQFLAENVFRTPTWLAPDDILSRIGPPAGGGSLATRQANVVTQLLDARRLMRLVESEALNEADAYSLTEYLGDLRRAVWGTPGSGSAPDANRRTMQRVYLERLEALISPPAPPAAGAPGGGGGGGGPQQLAPLFAAPNVPRTDLPAMARSQVRAIREEATRAAASAPAGVMRAHWQDVVARADEILEPGRGR
jgi:hypothetical protein